MHEYHAGYDEKLKSAYELYSEYAIYLELLKSGYKIDRIPEAQGEKRPDFRVSNGEDSIYIEAKILGWSGGSIQHNKAIESGIDAQIDIEKQIQTGKNVAFGISEYNPIGGGKDAQEQGEQYIIETLIKKLANNVKTGQLALGDTFLLCDITSLSLFPYPREESAAVHNFHNPYGSYTSGILWHIAFAKHGDMILKSIEFEGKPNVAGRLNQEGLMERHPQLAGVVFRTKGLGTEVKYTSMIPSAKFEKYGDIVTRLFDYWNDEDNSNAWHLLSDKHDGQS